jgi:hypothetical protein
MAKRRENPEALETFLERDAAAVSNHWLEITEAMLGPDNSDADWYKVAFPSSPWKLFANEGIEPDEHPHHVPFGSLKHAEAGMSQMFLAVDARDPRCPVDAWDAMNGEGWKRVADSLTAFKALLKKTRPKP